MPNVEMTAVTDGFTAAYVVVVLIEVQLVLVEVLNNLHLAVNNRMKGVMLVLVYDPLMDPQLTIQILQGKFVAGECVIVGWQHALQHRLESCQVIHFWTWNTLKERCLVHEVPVEQVFQVRKILDKLAWSPNMGSQSSNHVSDALEG
jgi:hypothetical protein